MSRCKLRMLFEPVLVPSIAAWLLAGLPIIRVISLPQADESEVGLGSKIACMVCFWLSVLLAPFVRPRSGKLGNPHVINSYRRHERYGIACGYTSKKWKLEQTDKVYQCCSRS